MKGRVKCWLGLLGLLLLLQKPVMGQDIPPLMKWVKESPTVLDSNGIWAFDFRVADAHGNTVPSEDYTIFFLQGILIFDSNKVEMPIQVFFRPLSESLPQSYSLFETVPNRGTWQTRDRFLITKGSQKTVLVPGLEMEGYVQRGMAAGQLNSSGTSELNLVLAGKVNGVTISGVLSDNNMPFQSGGTTAQIQEFNRIYINLQTDKHALTIGDVALQRLDSLGAQGGFQRRYRGLQFLQKGEQSLEVGVGQSRGEFFREVITLFTGVHGPYRLYGPTNEGLVQVMAGSETVWFNGVQLEREVDYSMNYQTGEFILSPNQVITREDRLVVDYQFVSRSYARLGAFAEGTWNAWGGAWTLGSFVESDLKNRNLLFQPDSLDLVILAQENAPWVRNRFASDTAIAPGVNYYVNTGTETHPVYVFSFDTTQQLIPVTFYYAGPNLGDYRIASTNGNGPIYEKVQPGSEVSGADFRVGRKLEAPESKQWFYIQFQSDTTSSGWFAGADLFHARQNANVFQSQVETGNLVQAQLGHFSKKRVWQWETSYKSALYAAPDPTDFIQKSMDWNTTTQELQTKEWLETDAQFRWNNERVKGHVQGRGFWMDKALLGGEAHDLEFSGSAGRILARGKTSGNGNNFWGEQLLEWRNGDSTQWKRKAFVYGTQRDSIPGLVQVPAYARAGGEISRQSGKLHFLLASFYQVHDQSTQPHFVQIRPQLTWTAKQWSSESSAYVRSGDEWTGVFRQKAQWRKEDWGIRTQGNAEVGRELILQRTYQFVEVPVGQGEYAYFDFNGNGQREIEEYYLSRYSDESNYIRLLAPSNTYVPVDKVAWDWRATWSGSVSPWDWLQRVELVAEQSFHRSSATELQLNLKNRDGVTEERRKEKWEMLYRLTDTWKLGYGHNHFQVSMLNVNGSDFQLQMGPQYGVKWTKKRKDFSLQWTDNQVRSFSSYALGKNYQYRNQIGALRLQLPLLEELDVEYLLEQKWKTLESESGFVNVLKVGAALSLMGDPFISRNQVQLGVYFVDIQGDFKGQGLVQNELYEGFASGGNWLLQMSGTTQLNDTFELGMDGGFRRFNGSWIGAGNVFVRANFN